MSPPALTGVVTDPATNIAGPIPARSTATDISTGNRTVDIIYIKDLAIETTIGIHDWERNIKQTILIDLDMGWDSARAGRTDDIAQALDYEAVATRTSDFVAQQSYELIEALAQNVAQTILKEFRLTWLRIRVRKPGALKNAGEVGVILERNKA